MKTHCLTSLDSSMFLLLLPVTEPLPWETLLVYLEPHLHIFQTAGILSRAISRYRLYHRRKGFLPSTDIISGSQNFLTRHTFDLAGLVIPQISSTHLSALLFYFRNAPTTLRTWTLAPCMLKKDLGMKTEMNALNYIELQVLQQDISTLWKYYTRDQSSPYSSM